MKAGDLVSGRAYYDVKGVRKLMLVVDIISKKCWRTSEHGRKIDWTKIDPEPHVVVIVGDKKMTIPLAELGVISEAR